MAFACKHSLSKNRYLNGQHQAVACAMQQVPLSTVPNYLPTYNLKRKCPPTKLNALVGFPLPLVPSTLRHASSPAAFPPHVLSTILPRSADSRTGPAAPPETYPGRYLVRLTEGHCGAEFEVERGWG